LLTELFGSATHDFGIAIMPAAPLIIMPPTPAIDRSTTEKVGASHLYRF